MTARPEQESNSKNTVLCPESTLKSANTKSPCLGAAPKNSAKRDVSKDKFACESTIGSALRRDFLKKAALVTAAVGVGGALLGGKMIPESSATAANIGANCLVVDDGTQNNGTWCTTLGNSHVLSFGAANCSPTITGEGIGSNRKSVGNLNGLDFYTAATKRMSITNGGYVGIGTCNPSSMLCVAGDISAADYVFAGANVSAGGSVSAGGDVFAGLDVFAGRNVCAAGNVFAGGTISAGNGILGCSGSGAAVFGSSSTGQGIMGRSSNPVVGKLKNNGTSGDRTALVQFETGPCSSLIDWSAGVSGLCNACKIPDGSFYVGQKGSPKLVVNTSGEIGIGTAKPQTTLQVKGGMSLNIKCTGTSCVTMKTSCFALFAPTAGKIITLPPAKNGGMVVFIKNTSTGSVTVKGAGSGTTQDKIEGLTTYSLAANTGITLIANGKSAPGTWYFLSNTT